MTGILRTTARCSSLIAVVCLALPILACDSSDSTKAEPTVTAVLPQTPAQGTPEALSETVRIAYEAFVTALNEERFDDAMDALSTCYRQSTSPEGLRFGRTSTGRLTIRSLDAVSSDDSQVVIAAEIVSEYFIGSQNLFHTEVPMINEDGRWLVDGPPKCTARNG